MLEWFNGAGIDCHYIALGKPQQNNLLERLSGKLRDECLKEWVFASLGPRRD